MSSSAPLAGTAADAPLSAPAPPPAAPPRQLCENCGAEVTLRYCGACGQRLEPPVHTLWHFTHVAAEDLTHADSRLWRTLGALLFRPGFLTAEFLAGRRARYLPPLRLYLVVSVAFFLVAAAFRPPAQAVVFDDETPSRSRVVPLDQLDSELARAPAAAAPGGKAQAGGTGEVRGSAVCENINYSGPWQSSIAPRLPEICRRIHADNGRSLMEAFLHNVPRAMFVFLPLLAGIMMLLYWRPRHYYVEHLLFYVHNHANVFLVFGVLLLLERLLPRLSGWLNFAVFVYLVWYVFRAMRVFYRQGRALTLAKFTFLAFCYLLLGSITVGLTMAYSALSL
jgi:hypothetical protein